MCTPSRDETRGGGWYDNSGPKQRYHTAVVGSAFCCLLPGPKQNMEHGLRLPWWEFQPTDLALPGSVTPPDSKAEEGLLADFLQAAAHAETAECFISGMYVVCACTKRCSVLPAVLAIGWRVRVSTVCTGRSGTGGLIGGATRGDCRCQSDHGITRMTKAAKSLLGRNITRPQHQTAYLFYRSAIRSGRAHIPMASKTREVTAL